ncbi:uncharacterized protein LOC124920088 [Impatiens glandulifera]|uniref:uncharacterized protein LOC124920088 n=1 Tax=Impatiens glandulifera TaxID=253017 RepID=UPI001FB115B0|nr:uncharacterized protein LOC124920088 [Impatiens glandulifera]
MKQGLLTWNPSCRILSLPYLTATFGRRCMISATVDSVQERELTAKERRQLRNERRESKPSYNWKEEVEEKLIKKPKKRYATWNEELNLDNLAITGPEWWAVKVMRSTAQETTERLARALVRNFPDIEFQVYFPAAQVKKKLKNGTISIKPKALFPGCVFLRCTLNREIHEFIRECDGVGGFVGSKVGNTKKMINLPRAVSVQDMEEIFKQAKEEQEKADQAFEEEEKKEQAVASLKPDELITTFVESGSENVTISVTKSKPKRRSRKSSDPTSDQSTTTQNNKLRLGSNVRVLTGTFAEFGGILKKLDKKTGKATVGFTLFGKETLVDLDIHEIVADSLTSKVS